MGDDDALLAGQIAYYRARAAEYDAFLAMVASALRPDGHAFFVDGLPATTSGRVGGPSPRTGEVQHRTLADGRAFDVVKNHWRPDELVERFGAAGLDLVVHETATYFQCGTATKAAGSAEGHG